MFVCLMSLLILLKSRMADETRQFLKMSVLKLKLVASFCVRELNLILLVMSGKRTKAGRRLKRSLKRYKEDLNFIMFSTFSMLCLVFRSEDESNFLRKKQALIAQLSCFSRVSERLCCRSVNSTAL